MSVYFFRMKEVLYMLNLDIIYYSCGIIKDVMGLKDNLCIVLINCS